MFCENSAKYCHGTVNSNEKICQRVLRHSDTWLAPNSVERTAHNAESEAFLVMFYRGTNLYLLFLLSYPELSFLKVDAFYIFICCLTVPQFFVNMTQFGCFHLWCTHKHNFNIINEDKVRNSYYPSPWREESKNTFTVIPEKP